VMAAAGHGRCLPTPYERLPKKKWKTMSQRWL